MGGQLQRYLSNQIKKCQCASNQRIDIFENFELRINHASQSQKLKSKVRK